MGQGALCTEEANRGRREGRADQGGPRVAPTTPSGPLGPTPTILAATLPAPSGLSSPLQGPGPGVQGEEGEASSGGPGWGFTN